MRAEVINPLTFSDYDALLSSTPDHSFFHSSAWARVLCESYGYRPAYFASIGEGRFHTLLPVMEVRSPLTGLRGISLPFTDECEPLADAESAPGIIREVVEHGRRAGWRSVEWRGAKGLEEDASPSQWFHGHTVRLSDNEGRMLSDFRDSTRRNIEKARKQGVAAHIDTSWGAVDAFCGLNCLTRREHGLPPQPRAFFRGLHCHAISRGHGFVVLAHRGASPIAGAVFLHLGSAAIYKYGASDRAHQGLRANNLVMWEGIRHCARLGCKSLSLGRTDPGHEGLLQFKRGWGAKEESIHYYRYDLRRSAFVDVRSRVTGWHNRFFARLPLPLSRLAGAMLYRHMA